MLKLIRLLTGLNFKLVIFALLMEEITLEELDKFSIFKNIKVALTLFILEILKKEHLPQEPLIFL